MFGLLGTLIGAKMIKAKKNKKSPRSSSFEKNENERSDSKNKEGKSKTSVKDLLASIDKNIAKTASMVGTVSSNLPGKLEKQSAQSSTNASFFAESGNKVDIPQEQSTEEYDETVKNENNKRHGDQNTEDKATSTPVSKHENDEVGNRSVTGESTTTSPNEISNSSEFTKIETKIISGIDNLNKYLSSAKKSGSQSEIIGDSTKDKKTGNKPSGNQISQESSNTATSSGIQNDIEDRNPETNKKDDNSQKSDIVGSVMSAFRKIADPFGIRGKFFSGIKDTFFRKTKKSDTDQTAIKSVTEPVIQNETGAEKNQNSTGTANENGEGLSNIVGSMTSTIRKLFDPFGIKKKIGDKIKKTVAGDRKNSGIFNIIQKSPIFKLFSSKEKGSSESDVLKTESDRPNTAVASEPESETQEPSASIQAQTQLPQTESNPTQQTTTNSSVEINNFTSQDSKLETNDQSGKQELKNTPNENGVLNGKAAIVPTVSDKISNIPENQNTSNKLENAESGVATETDQITNDNSSSEPDKGPNTTKDVKIDADSVKIVSTVQQEKTESSATQTPSIIPTTIPTTNATTLSTNQEKQDDKSSIFSKIGGLINPFSKLSNNEDGLFGKIKNPFSIFSSNSDDKSNLFGKIGNFLNPFSTGEDKKPNLLSSIGNLFTSSDKDDNKIEQSSAPLSENISNQNQNPLAETSEGTSNDIQQESSMMNNIEQKVGQDSSMDGITSGIEKAYGKLESIEELLTKLVDGMTKPGPPIPDMIEDEQNFDGSSII